MVDKSKDKSLEQRHAEARKQPPAYAVRKQLRERTLREGRGRCPECERSYGPHYRGRCDH